MKIKNQIKSNIMLNFVENDFGHANDLWTKIASKNHRPICKVSQFEPSFFTFCLQKSTNFDQSYFTQFLSYEGVLRLFGNLKRSSTSHFGIYFSFGAFILIISSLGKNCFWRMPENDL